MSKRKVKGHSHSAEPINFDNLWQCRCDCGEVMLVSRFDLESGAVTSCGCDGKTYYKVRITNADDPTETHTVISSKPLCPDCFERN